MTTEIRKIAPKWVGDAEIGRMLAETKRNPDKVRTRVEAWWREDHKSRTSALESTATFVKWLEKRNSSSSWGSEAVRRPPEGYVPPEVLLLRKNKEPPAKKAKPPELEEEEEEEEKEEEDPGGASTTERLFLAAPRLETYVEGSLTPREINNGWRYGLWHRLARVDAGPVVSIATTKESTGTFVEVDGALEYYYVDRDTVRRSKRPSLEPSHVAVVAVVGDGAIRARMKWYDAAAPPPPPPAPSSNSRLVSSLKDLWDRGLLTDVEVLASRGEAVEAHAVVLGARSSMLSAALARKEKKKATPPCLPNGLRPVSTSTPRRSIDLSEYDVHTVRHLLAFLYAGRLPSKTQFDVLCDLLDCAARFHIPDLFSACEDNLSGRAKIENATRLYHLAAKAKAARITETLVDLAINLADAGPSGIQALHDRAPRDLLTTDRVLHKLADSATKDTLIPLTALADALESPHLKAACLRVSLADPRARHNPDFRKVAASTSLGIEMLRKLAANAAPKTT
ncbi:hypothetical protein CTAYLR_001176 [Chrysophaeum taylorii]|uniref:BTB domain-containing protein n=1 Tax=Chrysophaeum taylorii TaxID=2483200 RepID=A0AAD7UQ32_9STRA|nr:hypothetical protein CTAYLR_001176 [Chrysophaeum taylorii]